MSDYCVLKVHSAMSASTHFVLGESGCILVLAFFLGVAGHAVVAKIRCGSVRPAIGDRHTPII